MTAASALRRAMDALYLCCVVIAGTALVLIALVIPWGVFTRYVLNSAASWPEPMAIFLTIVLTFFGAAACYRVGVHVSVLVVRNALAAPLRRAIELLAEGLMALVSLFMVDLGFDLGRDDLAPVDRRFPRAFGRRDLPADPDRRPDHAALRDRARCHWAATADGGIAGRAASDRLSAAGIRAWKS